MTKNILIEFTADARGITPAVESIEQFLNIDKALAASFDKLNSTLKQRATIIDTNNSSLAKFVQNLVNANKAAIGDTYAKTLEKIRQELQLADGELSKFYQDIISGSRAAIISSENEAEIRNFQDLISNLTLSLNELQQHEQPVDVPVTLQDEHATITVNYE